MWKSSIYFCLTVLLFSIDCMSMYMTVDGTVECVDHFLE